MGDPRVNLYHNLSVMLAAGVPLVRTLQTVHKQGRIGRIFQRIAAAAAASSSLAEAVEQHKKHFEPLDVVLIRVGEETGQLAEVFEMLSQWYEFRLRLRRTITSGLVLPALMIHALAILGPVPTFALGGWDSSQYLRSIIGILLLFYIPAAVVLGIVFLTPRQGLLRTVLDGLVLGIPVLGSAVRNLSLSRYSKVFAIALKAGIPILRATELALEAVPNAVIRRAVSGGVEAVKRGDNVSSGFSRLLPSDFVAIWQVGEETGDLDESAERLGSLYADSAERGFETLARWAPRLVYFIVVIVMAWYIFKGYSTLYGNLETYFPL